MTDLAKLPVTVITPEQLLAGGEASWWAPLGDDAQRAAALSATVKKQHEWNFLTSR